MTDPLRLATGTAEVLSSLRRSLAGDGLTVPLPTAEPERSQLLAVLPGLPGRPVGDGTSGVPGASGAIVATSGSTGHPRGVRLSAAALLASAGATHRRLGGPGSWVLALPVHYVAGLMVLVRSLVADRPVRTVDGRLAGLAELTPGAGPHYLSLVPTQLTRALADPALCGALARFDAVLLGGAAADPALLQRAETAGVRVVTTYGMSETCGGCVYDGVPLDGVEVTLEPGTERVVLAGPMLFSGYLDEVPATRSSLRTGDRGRWVGSGPQRRLQVLGRLDAVVVSGGRNVDLDAVERALHRVGGPEVAVVAVPDATWGARVVAIGPGVAERAEDLRSSLAVVLPGYALPRSWISVPELSRTAGGKVDRQRLIRELAEQDGGAR